MARTSPTLFVLAGLTLLLSASCSDPPVENRYPPKGVMSGTVVYRGKLPCSENGFIVGNAVMTVFNVNLLPPPEGLGTSAHRLVVVPGDVLFAGVADQIPVARNGERACPPDGAPRVTVSADWEVGPVDPGLYQVRGFVDYDGDFSPAFKMANLPTRGDVGGGAIDNLEEALQDPTRVRYQQIPVGVKDASGNFTIPETGYVARNITVMINTVIATNRPYFHVSSYRAGRDATGTLPGQEANPVAAVMPADFHMYDASVFKIHESTYLLELTHGVPEKEAGPAAAWPLAFDLDYQEVGGKTVFSPLFHTRYDANRDGVIDAYDKVTGAGAPVDSVTPGLAAPALAPILSLVKLDREHDSNDLWRTTQHTPRVISSLIVLPEGVPSLSGLLIPPWGTVPAPGQKPETTFVAKTKALLRPSAVCLQDPADRDSATLIVTPHERDREDNDEAIREKEETKKDIANGLSRNVGNVKIIYACLPPGYFSLNAIVPATGQAWTVPNESGLCMPGETSSGSAEQPVCGTRARLPSQFFRIQFGPASDPAYCNSRRKAPGEFDEYREYCLTPAERVLYDNGTLWGNPK
ncbi:MAG: hypothetical protein MUF54_04465 [Polyangiaceae bacterium]|nr:hypothetical protein [Polyangiaceae bacterium]